MEKKISHIKLSKLTFGDIEIEKKKILLSLLYKPINLKNRS